MLVMHHNPLQKDTNLTSVPFYIPLNRVATVHKFDLEKVNPQEHHKFINNIQKTPNNISKFKLDNSKEDCLKNNGPIPEEDKLQTDDLLPTNSDNIPSETTDEADENHRLSVEYSSHLQVNLEQKKKVDQKRKESERITDENKDSVVTEDRKNDELDKEEKKPNNVIVEEHDLTEDRV